jgi:hypothetical protein
MPQVFAQIELRGDAGPADYESLDAYMVALQWSGTVVGDAGNSFELPDGTYQQTFSDAPNMETMTNQLLAGIEQSVWTDAVVLCMQTDFWWQSNTD